MGDHVMASAILDRILHHCTVLNVKGKSYRLRTSGRAIPGFTWRSEKEMGNINMGGQISSANFGRFSLGVYTNWSCIFLSSES